MSATTGKFLRRFFSSHRIKSRVDAGPSLPTQPRLNTRRGQQHPRPFIINNSMPATAIGYDMGLNMPATPSPARPAAKKAVRDPVVPPSAESGGVPDPTAAYLALASQPPVRLPQPRNILVIIDLNGTLLFRGDRKNPTKFVARPYARQFLSYCINTFTVAVWSSARMQNVRSMCREIISPADAPKVVAIRGRESFGLTQADYMRRVQCYKRLDILWRDPDVAASHWMAAAVSSGQTWSQLDTVLIDDSLEKARSEPYNLVQVPEYVGGAIEDGLVLPQVHEYLNECSWQANISAFMRANPFRLDPGFSLDGNVQR
ncbi:HAD-like domain-containing protein [Xylariaceae sp. FL0594]|nr:HAD-like domain-containing protein [Xylariaceae sp. FL0594]